MRVVAGSARGRRLTAPRGLDIRPTSDRVREALFSIIGARVVGAAVLDLYCGSGALAVEALSRGAARATLVDSAAAAVVAAAENLERAGVSDQARVVRCAVEAFRPDGPYGIVMLDPPYATSDVDVDTVMEGLVRSGAVAGGTLVVAERSSERESPASLGPLMVTDARRYGTTRLIFAEG